MTTIAATVSERLIGTVTKDRDLEVHVREVSVDGESFLDVREYVPSSQRYGRGVMLDATTAKGLAKILRGV